MLFANRPLAVRIPCMKNDNELKRRDELDRKWKERHERIPAPSESAAAPAPPS